MLDVGFKSVSGKMILLVESCVRTSGLLCMSLYFFYERPVTVALQMWVVRWGGQLSSLLSFHPRKLLVV